MSDLLNQVKVTRCMNAVAAGTTQQNGTALDMAGYEGVLFLAAFGALTANQVTAIFAQEDDAAAMGNAANMTGTQVGPLADNASNKCLLLDVNQPQKRYVRCVVSRGTANAAIDGVWAIQYKPNWRPTTQDATTVYSSELHVNEGEGTI